jgi:hypothetical protein
MPDFAPPYFTRWPASLLHPVDVHEFVTATYLVHEAAHAVIAHDLDVPIRRMWARAADHPGGVEFAASYSWASSGNTGALIALAARPAVHAYLRLTGKDHPLNLATFEESFEHDDRDAETCGASDDLDDLRVRAELHVQHCWSSIHALAQKLGEAQGMLTGGEAFD